VNSPVTLILDPGAAMIAYSVMQGTTLLRWGHIRRYEFTKRKAKAEVGRRIEKLTTDFPVEQIVVELAGRQAKRDFDQDVHDGAQTAVRAKGILVVAADFEPYLKMSGLAGQQRADAFPQRRQWCQTVYHLHVPDEHICDTLILGYTFLQRQLLGPDAIPPHCEMSFTKASRRRQAAGG
jgi:hypothetical protein